MISSLTSPSGGGYGLDTAIAGLAAAELLAADPKRWDHLQAPATAQDAAARARPCRCRTRTRIGR